MAPEADGLPFSPLPMASDNIPPPPYWQPLRVHPAQWLVFEAFGLDMWYYRLIEPIPTLDISTLNAR